MTGRLQQTTGRKMVKASHKLGFEIKHTTGSHHTMKRGTRVLTVPYHNKDLGRGLMMDIIKQAGLTIDEIRPYL